MIGTSREHPHSLDAERSALGSVLIQPSAFEVVATLVADDFFHPTHREIFQAMGAIQKRRQPMDHVLLWDELKARGQSIALEGGENYLMSLPGCVPASSNIEHYVRQVKELSNRRRGIVLCAETQARLHGDGAALEIATQAAVSFSAIADASRSKPRWRSLADRSTSLGDSGARLLTGLGTLDAATRGGWRTGGVAILGGAPGAGKTTLLAQLGLGWARAGHQVALLAADESARGILIRIGQGFGFARDALESGAPDGLSERLSSLPNFLLVDADEETAAVEDVAAELRGRAAGRPSVLLVDSIQKVRAVGTAEAGDPRPRVDAVMASLKTAARAGALVVVTCELARGAYRSRRPEDRAEDLASFKESGGIEYGADLALVLRNVPGQSHVVDVAMAKNRWGQRSPARLVLDPERATFTEVAIPAGAAQGLELNSEALFEADIEAARDVLRASPGIAGRDKLCSLMKGYSKERQRAAIRALDQAGEIENRGSQKRPRLYLSASHSPESPQSPRSPGESGRPQPAAPAAPFREAGSGAGSSGGFGAGYVDGSMRP